MKPPKFVEEVDSLDLKLKDMDEATHQEDQDQSNQWNDRSTGIQKNISTSRCKMKTQKKGSTIAFNLKITLSNVDAKKNKNAQANHIEVFDQHLNAT